LASPPEQENLVFLLEEAGDLVPDLFEAVADAGSLDNADLLEVLHLMLLPFALSHLAAHY
jgi:hypothetical protein